MYEKHFSFVKGTKLHRMLLDHVTTKVIGRLKGNGPDNFLGDGERRKSRVEIFGMSRMLDSKQKLVKRIGNSNMSI